MFREVVVAANIVSIQIGRLLELAGEDSFIAGRTRIDCRQRNERKIRHYSRVDRRARRQKSAFACGQAGNRLYVSGSQHLAKSFIRAEDEKFILDDWTAESKAELIPLERRRWRASSSLEKVCSVSS